MAIGPRSNGRGQGTRHGPGLCRGSPVNSLLPWRNKAWTLAFFQVEHGRVPGTRDRSASANPLTVKERRCPPSTILTAVRRSRSYVWTKRARRACPWRQWGPYLSERQWGTVREDYSENGDAWNYFTPRSGPLACLSLGRGWSRRVQRRPPASVLFVGPVERQGSDPQGAAVRPDQQRGQSRRGRQGILLLPRCDADPLVYEVPLQISADRVSLRRSRRDKPAARPQATWNTSCSIPASSTTIDTSTCSSSTRKAAPDDILIQIKLCNRGPEAATLHCLPTLWFRNTWTGGPISRNRPCGKSATEAPSRRSRRRMPNWASSTLHCEGTPQLAVHRKRDQQRAALRLGQRRRPTSRTGSTTTSWRASRTPSIRIRRGPRRPHITRSTVARRRDVRRSACG